MKTETAVETQIPGYVAGSWTIDPAHTDISFVVRHMMVSKVRGRFERFEGEIITGEELSDSSVNATIALDSVNTNNEQRDNHIRSADFFEVEKYPTMTFRSTGLRLDHDAYTLEGELTLKGVTKPIELALELNGFSQDPWGGTRVGFSASTEISRTDFGVDIHMPMDGGGVVVGDKVTINLEIEAVLNQ